MNYPRYTGEGFKGEKLLNISVMLLSIVSTLLLIRLTTNQARHTKLAIEEIEKRNGKK